MTTANRFRNLIARAMKVLFGKSKVAEKPLAARSKLRRTTVLRRNYGIPADHIRIKEWPGGMDRGI